MSEVPDTVPPDEPDAKVDLQADARFQEREGPTHFSESLTAGITENKQTGQQLAVIVQKVITVEGPMQIAQPMDIGEIDSLVATLLNVKQALITAKVKKTQEEWTVKPPTQTTMDKQTAQRLEKAGYKTVLDVYRAGPTVIRAVNGITKGAVVKLHEWFRSHEIAWADPKDNHMDPRNREKG